jgi:hypothetical protein
MSKRIKSQEQNSTDSGDFEAWQAFCRAPAFMIDLAKFSEG